MRIADTFRRKTLLGYQRGFRLESPSEAVFFRFLAGLAGVFSVAVVLPEELDAGREAFLRSPVLAFVSAFFFSFTGGLDLATFFWEGFSA
ncbi:MAG: hypothetical protein V3V75_04905, partial [Thermoguttaceae bacterium]